MQRKRTIIQPVKPDGKILDPILVEKGILEQIKEFLRDLFAVYGFIVFGYWAIVLLVNSLG